MRINTKEVVVVSLALALAAGVFYLGNNRVGNTVSPDHLSSEESHEVTSSEPLKQNTYFEGNSVKNAKVANGEAGETFNEDWERIRANRTEKMEEWIRQNHRWEAYQTFLNKYTDSDWVKGQFPHYGDDSLELARRMLVQQAALLAMMYTPAETERLRLKGIDVERYFAARHNPTLTESLLARSEVAAVVVPVSAEEDELADGFASNAIAVVIEGIKGYPGRGDTIRIRQRGGRDKASSTDLVVMHGIYRANFGFKNRPILVYLTQRGAMHFTTDEGVYPVRLPTGVYYLNEFFETEGESILVRGSSHSSLLSEVRRLSIGYNQ